MVDVVYDGPRSYLLFQGIVFKRGVPVQIHDYAALGRLQMFRDFRISREVVLPSDRNDVITDIPRKGGWPKGRSRKPESSR